MLCRMATAAGAALCLVALAAPLAWQGLFLAGLMIAALDGRRAAALAGVASAALLIAAPFIGAAPWGPLVLRWPGWIWATSAEVDPAALRTIAALAILLLANSVSLPHERTSPVGRPPRGRKSRGR
jgi:hypothetical protein